MIPASVRACESALIRSTVFFSLSLELVANKQPVIARNTINPIIRALQD